MIRKILVIGLGISGRSCAAFLLKKSLSVVAVDQKYETLALEPEILSLIEQGLLLFSDKAPLSLEEFSQVVLSPGIPPTHPLVEQARLLNIEVVGEIELAFRHLKNRCIGVTGSNGKTSTTLLLTHVLNEMGIKARALGNVGASLTGYLIEPKEEEILVVELSSFQLETLQTKRLDAAVILNITANHLDRHPSMEAYAKAKLQIQHCLKEEGGTLYVSSQIASQYAGDLKRFKCFDSPEVYEGSQNEQAAFALASFLGVSSFDFREKAKTFKKPMHRIEWVAEIDGVTYYNDSKATNVDAVLHAVTQLEGPLILLAGGVDKGGSYRPWIKPFLGKVKKIVVFGRAADKIEKELSGIFSLEKKETLQEALIAARREAVKKDTILLSPGCSSYDQFVNYEARGEEFKRMVRG